MSADDSIFSDTEDVGNESQPVLDASTPFHHTPGKLRRRTVIATPTLPRQHVRTHPGPLSQDSESEGATLGSVNMSFEHGDADECTPSKKTFPRSPVLDRLGFQEVRSLLSTDLPRMPDVRALITRNAMKIDSLHEVVIQNLPNMSSGLVAKLINVPAFRTTISQYLLNEDEQWSDYLKRKLASGTDFVDAFRAGLQDKFKNWTIPTKLSIKLSIMPAVRKTISDYVVEMERSGIDMVTNFVAPYVSRMKDIQSLVYNHMHNLPFLQKLREAHYQGKPELKTFKYTPKWMADNPYIVGGYRPELLSFSRCFYSLTYLHNETGNIYTHLIGGLIFIALAVYVITHQLSEADAPTEDKVLFGVFWTTAVCCLAASSVYHTFACHSHSVHLKFAKIDYLGIVLLISGSTLAVLYFTFYCDYQLRVFYMSFTTISGIIAAWATCSTWFDGNSRKALRVMFFIALAATAVVPMLHFNFLYGVEHLLAVIDEINLLVLSCPLYLVGSFFFVFKVPERFFPGKLDIWFHSHQLWHIFVISAAYFHYRAIWTMMHFRHSGDSCELERTVLLGGP